MKTITAYAIVNKKKPIIKVRDIYPDRDVEKNDDEMFIQVEIVPTGRNFNPFNTRAKK